MVYTSDIETAATTINKCNSMYTVKYHCGHRYDNNHRYVFRISDKFYGYVCLQNRNDVSITM